MKKKYLRLFSIIFGSVLLFAVLANFGINYWLKNNLPDYIKKNSSYNVTYKKLDVDLLSGNITAENISLNNKNPNEKKKLGLQGTIDTLQISRLGIYDAIFNKSISTNSITLKSPVLNIRLPEKKSKKSQNPIEINEVNIVNGKIQIFKNNTRKLLSVSNLNLEISGLELNDENTDNNLPLGFDSYSITGEKLYFRPNNLYLILADKLKTKDGELKINQFRFLPLMSFEQFQKYYPEKSSLFNLQSKELALNDFKFKNKKIDLKNLLIFTPNIKIYTTEKKAKKQAKDFEYVVNLENIALKDAKIDIEKPNKTPLFLAENLSFNISKIKMTSETATQKIPFQYKDFEVTGKNLDYFTNSEHLKLASATINPKEILLNTINFKSSADISAKNNFDLQTKSILVKIKSWEMANSKLKLEIADVLINDLNGKIKTAEVKSNAPKKNSFLEFPLNIDEINLKNSNLNIETKGKPLALNGLNLNINNLQLSQNQNQKLLLKSGDYNFNLNKLVYNPSQFYRISANNFSVTSGKGSISNFAMTPLVSRGQYIKMIPVEKDLYDLKAQNISFMGSWDLLNPDKFLDLTQVTLNKVNANIFRSKIPKDDLSVKFLYSKMLRDIKIPIFIADLNVKNSVLTYEEDIPTSNGPGKLLFSPFNMAVKNINSAKMKGKPTKVAITINAGLMGTSPLNIKWGFDVADSRDRFTIVGTAKELPADKINPFIQPYLNVKATGLIKELSFNLNGNPTQISGSLKMQHDNLKVAILKKDSNEKNKLLTGIANIFIKSDSDKFPESVEITNVERDNTKSFFNLLWKGLQDGLAQTLIGISYKKNIDNVKTTVKNAKDAVKNVKSEVKEVKGVVKNATEAVKSTIDTSKEEPKKKEEKKKKGFFERIFK